MQSQRGATMAQRRVEILCVGCNGVLDLGTEERKRTLDQQRDIMVFTVVYLNISVASEAV